MKTFYSFKVAAKIEHFAIFRAVKRERERHTYADKIFMKKNNKNAVTLQKRAASNRTTF